MTKGDIWFVELPEGKGHEQKGSRPGIICSRANGLSVVIPLTTNRSCSNLQCTHVIEPTKENGLSDDSVALVFQITSVDKSRFIRKMGKISDEEGKNIDDVLKTMLKLG